MNESSRRPLTYTGLRLELNDHFNHQSVWVRVCVVEWCKNCSRNDYDARKEKKTTFKNWCDFSWVSRHCNDHYDYDNDINYITDKHYDMWWEPKIFLYIYINIIFMRFIWNWGSPTAMIQTPMWDSSWLQISVWKWKKCCRWRRKFGKAHTYTCIFVAQILVCKLCNQILGRWKLHTIAEYEFTKNKRGHKVTMKKRRHSEEKLNRWFTWPRIRHLYVCKSAPDWNNREALRRTRLSILAIEALTTSAINSALFLSHIPHALTNQNKRVVHTKKKQDNRENVPHLINTSLLASSVLVHGIRNNMVQAKIHNNHTFA